MPAVTARNTSAADDRPPQPPLQSDGTPYPLSMFYAGGSRVAYAENPADLVAVLVGDQDYPGLPADRRLQARIEAAVRAQVAIQAEINANADLTTLTPEQKTALTGPRHVPPALGVWTPEIPLVLVDAFYEPWPGGLPRPASGLGDYTETANLIWLSAAEDWDLLVSLHDAGNITVHELVA